jgi:hypothetical protein
MSKVTTLKEVETHYDIIDLLDINELLNLQEEVERKSALMAKSSYK